MLQQQAALCSVCRLHGLQAGGNPALHARKFERQGDWYSEAAIENIFKNGARGTHEKDVFGKMMAPIGGDGWVMTPPSITSSLISTRCRIILRRGRLTKSTTYGQKLYVTCGACHGADGRGMPGDECPRLGGNQ